MLSLSKKEIADKLDAFVWNYKVGDNIAYNFQQLYFFYHKKEIEKSEEKKKLYNKHLSITIVSIIEGIFYDLITRLDGATNHFPDSITASKEAQIKAHLDKDKQWFMTRLGRRKRVKNYKLGEIRDFLKRYLLLGSQTNPIYSDLEEAIFLRNRIHIFNWFGNFERDEQDVFSDTRLVKLEKLLVKVINGMFIIYPRPTPCNQAQNWLDLMN